MLGGSFEAAVLCYNYAQPIYREWYETCPLFLMHRGWPSERFVETTLRSLGSRTLLIMDDLEEVAISKKEHSALLSRLFTGYR